MKLLAKHTITIFILLNFNPTFGQFKLIDEKISSNEIQLKIESQFPDCKIEKSSEPGKIIFEEFDYSINHGTLMLPQRDLFIAIPPDASPTISIDLSEKEVVAQQPYYINSSTAALVKMNDEQPSFYQILGNVWVEKNYVLHIRINLFNYDAYSGEFTFNKNFIVKLKFDEQLKFDLNKADSNSISTLIINKKFASSVQQEPKFAVSSNDDWIDFSKQYLKLGVAQDAIYRLTPNQLQQSGVNVPNIDPRTFKIFKRGEEQLIHVEGESDGAFNSQDFIEFFGERNNGGKHRTVAMYGEPFNEYLDRYSDTTTYWLTWGGNNGKRAEVISSFPSEADTQKYYYDFQHIELNPWLDYADADIVRKEMPFWVENKTWQESGFDAGSFRSKVFNVSDVFPNTDVYVYGKVLSFANDQIINAYRSGISLNSLSIQDSGYFNKYSHRVMKGIYNSNLMNPGKDTVKLHAFATTSTINRMVTDWFELEYPRFTYAELDSLNMNFSYSTANTQKHFTIDSVQADTISIWSIGSELKKIIPTRAGTKLLFVDSVNATKKIIFNGDSKIKTPRIYYLKQFNDLTITTNQADYIAITGNLLLSKAREYAQFISLAYTVSTIVVDVDDIYDQFGFGFFNPETIKEFLIQAKNNWQTPKPKYVCLIGEATYDYHQNKAKYAGAPRTENIVPSFGVPVSDNWFVMFDSTNALIPQMNIGRIPSRNEVELTHYLNKHKKYLLEKTLGWNKRFIFFSGGSTNDQNGLDELKNVNNYVINNFASNRPLGGKSAHFYKTINPRTNFGPFTSAEIQATIDSGAVCISYLGHSGTQTWDNSITEVSQLKNKNDISSLITDFGCSTARFAEPDITSFSELFVSGTSGQAIAYIGNASLGFLSTSLAFPKIFYETLLKDSIKNISQALNFSKQKLLQNFGSGNVYKLFVYTNTLIGDPIVSLQLPEKPNLNISQSSFSLEPVIPSDKSDSVFLKVNFANYGLAPADSFSLSFKVTYRDSAVISKSISFILPLFNDSLTFSIPVKGKAGQFAVLIELDKSNKIDESDESDNQATYYFNVNSSALRNIISAQNDAVINQKLVLLNPASPGSDEKLVLQLSGNSDFSSPKEYMKPLQPFMSVLTIDTLGEGKRYWFRSKLYSDQSFAQTYSAINSSEADLKYLVSDSISFASLSLEEISYKDGRIALDTTNIQLTTLSAGYYDGKTALISLNGQNLIPENTLGGHHVCLFDPLTFKFISYHYFDRYQTSNFVNNYATFLDTLSSNYIVAIAVADEGYISETSIKNGFKSIGSKFSESIGFRSSWTIIGRKGAAIGSVPESLTTPFNGNASADSSLQLVAANGKIISRWIEPAASWKQFYFEGNNLNSLNTKISFITKKINGSIDTLKNISFTNQSVDLTAFNNQSIYSVRFIIELTKNDSLVVPTINKIKLNYISASELGTNGQVVSINRDSILFGEKNLLTFSIFNAGEARADSFNVNLEVTYPDNSRKILQTFFVDTLNSMSRKDFSYEYFADVAPNSRTFVLTIDPENKIPEIFEDNNFFAVPFYVKGDTSKPAVKLFIDDNDFVNGDFISSTPTVRAELFDPSLILNNDTSSVQLFLDDKRIFNNDPDLTFTLSPTNPKITLTYKPTLAEGAHEFRVRGFNINKSDTDEVVQTATVSNSLQILSTYNYPNPFNSETYFTFRLPQVPDEIKIKIYTVAGRLVKEISLNKSQLKYDFNKIYWDGRDADGDLLANGVYIYKVILKKSDRTETITQKLAIAR